jgi:hemoglobin
MTAPTLYEHAGGADAFERLTAAFYANVRRDDLLEPLFRDMPPDHPKRVAAWGTATSASPSSSGGAG